MKKILIAISSVLLITSCTKDFEEVNKNPLLPDEQQKTLDGLASVGLFPGFIAGIIPTATGAGTEAQNNYQVTSCMTGDIWSGYVGVGYQWDGGISTPNFYIKDNRKTGIFTEMLKSSIETFQQIKSINHDVIVENGVQVFRKKDIASQANYSVAQIIKIMGIHRLTDMYGPIPYSKIGGGKLIAPYDSQQQVYTSMLAELQEAVETLNAYKENGGTKILADNYQKNDFSGLSIFLAHGISDQIIPVQWAEEAVTFLKELNIDCTCEEFSTGHNIAPEIFYSFKEWLNKH